MAEVVPYIQLEHKISFLKKRQSKFIVVATNGCFDILHIGHIRYLQKAKLHGNLLVVGINADKSIKSLKGECRPINNELIRAEMLAALECVDIVSIFPEDTADNFLLKVRPNIYIKGGDYNLESLPEANTIKEMNIKFSTIPMVPGFSTTSIIERLQRY